VRMQIALYTTSDLLLGSSAIPVMGLLRSCHASRLAVNRDLVNGLLPTLPLLAFDEGIVVMRPRCPMFRPFPPAGKAQRIVR
jgi:hypothetical protein